MIETKYPLMDHQEKAYKKLKSLKVGALFMDMGTGKTRTVIEIIKDKINKGRADKVIWFCPCSAKVNIKHELEKHINSGLDTFLIVGIESMSSSIKLNSFLITYVHDNRCILIVDESSKIKNFNAKRSERIINLGRRCKYKYILNGTPITKNEIDLFSQMYFLDWRILGYRSQWSFYNNHVEFDREIKNKIKGTKNTEYLAKRIAPYTYQVKLDECVSLPQRIFTQKEFCLSKESKDQYQEVGDYLLSLVDEWKPTTIYRLFECLQAITSGFVLSDDDNLKKIGYFDTTDTNPRLGLLVDITDQVDGKVIIYAKYIKEIEVIKKILSDIYGEDEVCTFYGRQKFKDRQDNEQKFRDSARFMITNKQSASFSLNWQFCHQIIYYNHDWDWGTRKQSEDRIHRIGQDKKCLYIDIVADKTIENYIIKCLYKKENLAESFKNDVDSSKDLRELLALRQKKGKLVKEEIKAYKDLEE